MTTFFLLLGRTRRERDRFWRREGGVLWSGMVCKGRTMEKGRQVVIVGGQPLGPKGLTL